MDIVNDILGNPFSKRSFEEKIQIKNKGRPTPELPSLIKFDKNKPRSFKSSWYDNYLWLTASVERNKLFCWPCLLFPTRESANDIWSKLGFDDLKNLSRALSRHSISSHHTRSEINLKFLNENNRIEKLIDTARELNIKNHNEKVEKNRKILIRLIDMTSYLARQELPFRGHDESESSSNKGNYKELYDLIAKNDELLKNCKDSKVFSGQSKKIQNDIIKSISTVLINYIYEEVKDSTFFSWEIDETTDISCSSQLSIIIRYAKDAQIYERFIGFTDVSSNRSAENLTNVISNQMSKFDFSTKLIAQAYDGAAVMSSELHGLQSRIKNIAPQAIFIHCHAHKLNLVLSRGMNNIPKVKIFFSKLSGISSFFSKSTKRTAVLNEYCAPRIPTGSNTRWNYSSRIVNTVYENKEVFINVLEKIRDGDNFDDQSICDACGLLVHLLDFEFNFFLEIFNKIFVHTEYLFDILQKKSYDIGFCIEKTNNVKSIISNFKTIEEFSKIYELILKNYVEPSSKILRQSDKTSVREYYCSVFFEIINSIIMQMNTRFSDFEKINFIDLVKITEFKKYAHVFPYSHFSSLEQNYKKFFNLEKLKQELIVLYSDEKLYISSKSSLDLAKFFVQNDLTGILPETYKLLNLILTLPITTASTERSFSALKRIKTFCRNTIHQDRLSDLAIISIEKELLKKLELSPDWYDKVINVFAGLENRKIELHYKK